MSRFVSSVVNAIGSSWCQLMHPDPMWPVKGEYQCRVCLRKFPVSWEREEEEDHQHAPASVGGKAISPVTLTTTIH